MRSQKAFKPELNSLIYSKHKITISCLRCYIALFRVNMELLYICRRTRKRSKGKCNTEMIAQYCNGNILLTSDLKIVLRAGEGVHITSQEQADLSVVQNLRQREQRPPQAFFSQR